MPIPPDHHKRLTMDLRTLRFSGAGSEEGHVGDFVESSSFAEAAARQVRVEDGEKVGGRN